MSVSGAIHSRACCVALNSTAALSWPALFVSFSA